MACVVVSSKKQKQQGIDLEDGENNIEIQGYQEQEENNNNNEDSRCGCAVTNHLYLKPAHGGGTLDREAVLRRIRQRKRANKAKAAFHALLSSPFGSNNNKPSQPQIRWLDDAFAAP